VVQQAATGQEMFARKATVEYHAPARFDDMLDIGVRCAALGRSSMRYVLEIYRGEEHLVSGELVYVYADVAARKGVAVPEDWRAALCSLEKMQPGAQ
jgi:acyl-CoA thioester hydrolase